MAIVRITDLTLKTIIGTNAWERTNKQKVVINARFEYNAVKAAKTDNIREAVDYKAITKKIISRVTVSRFFLLERLANEIIKIILATPKVTRATVRVDKPLALRHARSVSVEVSKRR